MVLLIGFDLPRNTPEERRQATLYRKRLVELGFSMIQYSLYEREVRQSSTKDRLIRLLRCDLPDTGQITIYLLTDEIHDSQITLLGTNAVNMTSRNPRLIVI